MNREDIIRMAREIGYPLAEYETGPYVPPLLETLLKHAVAAEREALEKEWPVKFASVKAFEDWCASIRSNEREACAQILDGVDNYANPMTANDCAAAIRARGQA